MGSVSDLLSQNITNYGAGIIIHWEWTDLESVAQLEQRLLTL